MVLIFEKTRVMPSFNTICTSVMSLKGLQTNPRRLSKASPFYLGLSSNRATDAHTHTPENQEEFRLAGVVMGTSGLRKAKMKFAAQHGGGHVPTRNRSVRGSSVHSISGSLRPSDHTAARF